MSKNRKSKIQAISDSAVEKVGEKDTFSRQYLYLLVIIIITAIVYSNSLSNGFVHNWDDNENVTENPHLTGFSNKNISAYFTQPFAGMYVPLTMLSYAIDITASGLNPFTFHFSNLLFHLLNVLLVFVFIRTLSGNAGIGLAVAVLFAVHPLNVEGVSWISTRSNVLYSFFFLLACIAYLKFISEKRSTAFYVPVMALFILSCLAKPAAITLPFVLLLLDLYITKKISFRNLVEKIPLFALTVLFAYITYEFRETSKHLSVLSDIYSIPQRLLFVCYSVFFYLKMLFMPIGLNAFYSYPELKNGWLPFEYYIAPFILLLAVLGIYKSGKYRMILLFGVGFYFFCISPVLKIVPVGFQIVAERYAYIPALGIFFCASKIFYDLVSLRFSDKNRELYSVLIILPLVFFFSYQSFQRNFAWKNDITLFTSMIASDPKQDIAYYNRGISRVQAGDTTGAILDYTLATEINPLLEIAFFNMAILKEKTGRKDEAILDYSSAIKAKPDYADAYNNRGSALLNEGKVDEAIRDFSIAIKINDTLSVAYYNRGIANARSTEKEKAVQDFDYFIAKFPDHKEAYFRRANVKASLKHYEEALQDYDKAIQLAPASPIIFFNRGSTKGFLNDMTGAIEDYSRAIELNPEYAKAYTKRGQANLISEKLKEACADWQNALSLGDVSANELLGNFCK